MATVDIRSLPFELLLHVFALLPGNDIVNFLSISHAYRALVIDESIWRELCSRFGVHNLSSFRLHDPNRTFFTVYTELLHTYGPLLGLWASDNVFQGNVLQFRIVSESQECGWEGIIGEVWRFQPRSMTPTEISLTARIPSVPDYYECLRIELLPTDFSEATLQAQAGDGENMNGLDHVDPLYANSDETRSPRLTRFTWFVHNHIPGTTSTFEPAHRTTLSSPIRLIAPHNQAFYVYKGNPGPQYPYETYSWSHPQFPPLQPDHLWYDEARSMPHLRLYHEPVVDHRPLLPTASVHTIVRLLYLAPSDEPTPWSITVLPPPGQVDAIRHNVLHNPPYNANITDLRRIQQTPAGDLVWAYRPGYSPEGHYFPLRFPIVPGGPDVEPSEDGWTPGSLEGLWLGSYSTHGTELLFVKWARESGEVQGWKVTGDCNVPRGALSWRFNPAFPTPEPDELVLEEMNLRGTPRSHFRMHGGIGTVSAQGYTDDTTATIPLLVAIAGKDEIRIRWLFDHDMSYVPRYRRYRGRDVASEIIHRDGVRRPS